MRVAVVDIGTNSTRLLVADVDDSGRVDELVRESRVTRLGAGVDANGTLAPDAIERVRVTLSDYRRQIDEHGAQANLAVLTSAVRDASNGAAFTAAIADEFGLDARTLSGDEEARLTFLGATSERHAPPGEGPIVVVDIGGGSTEFIIGSAAGDGVHEPDFHVSTQAGVVRMTERHIHGDPARPEELLRLGLDVREVFMDALRPVHGREVSGGIAVAGTATSAAAMDQRLEPYDPARVHGYHLGLETIELLVGRLGAMSLSERREVPGLHPDRASTIVAGMILLAESLRAFALEEVEVSEHDILRGGALLLAGRAPTADD